MKKLGNPTNTLEVLKKHNFVIQKKYGQNFLIDGHILENIIKSAEINKDDFVIEIGPGIGTLTQYLCESAREVVAIEIDKMLIPVLKDTLSGYDNITVLNQDILKTNLKELIKERNNSGPVKVVANLPYYITTPIIMELFKQEINLTSITVMVQKEVAMRMEAEPGSKDYGALSLAVQYHSEAAIMLNVPPNCFIPRPNVASSVIRLTSYKAPPVEVIDEKLMFQIIRASFNQRRKTLVNGIRNAGIKNLDKNEIEKILLDLDLGKSVRGEDLSLEEFAKISDKISLLV